MRVRGAAKDMDDKGEGAKTILVLIEEEDAQVLEEHDAYIEGEGYGLFGSEFEV